MTTKIALVCAPLAETLITSNDVCAALLIGKRTLTSWRRDGLIEYVKFGHRTVRYPRREVQRLLESKTRPAQQPNCANCGHVLYCLSCDHPQKAQASATTEVRQ